MQPRSTTFDSTSPRGPPPLLFPRRVGHRQPNGRRDLAAISPSGEAENIAANRPWLPIPYIDPWILPCHRASGAAGHFSSHSNPRISTRTVHLHNQKTKPSSEPMMRAFFTGQF